MASHCVSIADRHRRVAEVEQPSKPFRFSLQINAGCVAEAEQPLDQVLEGSLKNLSCFRFSLQINAGRVAEAEQLLDQVLEGSPKDLGALVARGTARALRKELAGKG